MASWDFSGGWGTPDSQVVQTYGAGSEYDNWLQDWNKRLSTAQSDAASAAAAHEKAQEQASNALLGSAGGDAYWRNAPGGPMSQAPTNPAAYAGGLPMTSKIHDGVGGDTTTDTGKTLRDQVASMWGGGMAPGQTFTPEALAQFNQARQDYSSYTPPSFQSFYDEKDAKSGDANAYAEGQNRNLDAFKQMTGGGYQGGFLSNAYAAPFGDLGASIGGLDGASGAASGLGQSTPNGIAGSGEPTGYGTFQGVQAPPNPYAKEQQMNAGFRNPFDMWR